MPMNQLQTPYQHIMKLRELPPEIRDAIDMPPDTEVEVTVMLSREEKGRRLTRAMDEMAAQAKANGLTEEILDEILNEK